MSIKKTEPFVVVKAPLNYQYKKLLFFGALFLAPFITLAAIAYYMNLINIGLQLMQPAVPKVEIDMSKPLRMTDVYGSKNYKPSPKSNNDFGGIDGPVDVTILMHDGSSYSARAKSISLMGEKGRVRSVSVYSEEMTLDKAYHKAKQIVQKYGCQTARLDKWYAKSKKLSSSAAVNHGRTYNIEDNKKKTCFSVSVRHSYDRKKPWSVLFNYYWGLEEQEAFEKQMKEKDDATQTKSTP